MNNQEAMNLLLSLSYFGPFMFMIFIAFVVPYSKYLSLRKKIYRAKTALKTIETHTLKNTEFNKLCTQTLLELENL